MTSDRKSKKLFKDVVLIVLSFILAIALLIYTFRGVQFKDVWNYVERSNYFYLSLFIIIVYIGVVFRALRWKYILESVKHDIKFINLFNSVIIGYGLNVVLPRFGEFFRAVYLARKENISRGSAIGTIFIERLIDLIFLLITVFISILSLSEQLTDVYPWLYSSIYIALAGLVVFFLFLIFLIRYQEKLFLLIKKQTDKFQTPALKNISVYINKIIDGFSTIRTKRAYTLIIIHSALMWFSYSLGAYVALFIFDMQKIIPVGFSAGWVIMAITTFGVMIPTPAGTGSYHAFCKSVLTAIYGYEVNISLAYAVLTHLINSVPFLIITIIIYLFSGRKNFNLFRSAGEE